MVGPLLGRFGLAPEYVKPSVSYLMLPAAESAIALGLCLRKTRPFALAGALAMHAGLILFLGPLGRRQSGILLIWNAALMLEDFILFRSKNLDAGAIAARERPWESWVRLTFVFAAVLPFGERFGLWDAWPSFALYAAHVERTELFIAPDAAELLPIEARNTLLPIAGEPWFRLDPTSWSRAVRSVPVYPSNRASNGLARAIAEKVGRDRLVRVVEWGRAERFSGRRERREAIGPEQIRRLGDRYRLNARPEGIFILEHKFTDNM